MMHIVQQANHGAIGGMELSALLIREAMKAFQGRLVFLGQVPNLKHFQRSQVATNLTFRFSMEQ